MPFVCLVPVRPLLSSTAVLYYVNGKLQRLVRFKLALNMFISHMARERQPGEQATLWYLKGLLNPFEWAPKC